MRRRRRDRGDRRDRPARAAGRRDRRRRRHREHGRAAARCKPGDIVMRDARERRSRSTTPTPRAGSCSLTASPTRRAGRRAAGRRRDAHRRDRGRARLAPTPA